MTASKMKVHQPFDRDSLIYTFQIEVSGLEMVRSKEAGGIRNLIKSAFEGLLETEFKKMEQDKNGNE